MRADTQYWAGDPDIVKTMLAGSSVTTMLGDSIDSYDYVLKLQVYPFKKLIGCTAGAFLTGGLAGVATSPVSTFTQPDWSGTGPPATPSSYWGTQIWGCFAFTATGTVPADAGNNSNVMMGCYPTDTNTIFHPRGTAKFLDGYDMSVTAFVYRNASGITNFHIDVFDWGLTTLQATLTAQSAAGAAGVVAYTVPTTGVRNWGTLGFRCNTRLTAGASVTSGQNFVLCDMLVKATGTTGQVFTQISYPGLNSTKLTDSTYMTPANFVLQLQLLGTTVCLIKLDQNSASAGLTATQHGTALTALLEQCRLANSSMKFVIMSQYDNSAVDQTLLTAIAAKDREITLARTDCCFLDINAAAGDSAQIVAAGFINAGDTVHDNENNTQKLWVLQQQARLMEMANAAADLVLSAGGRMGLGL